MSHTSPQIRDAESSGLNHTPFVAKANYCQNPQYKPMMLIQHYNIENNNFPSQVETLISASYSKVEHDMERLEEERKKVKREELLREIKEKREIRDKHRDLGPKNRVIASDRDKFLNLIEESKGSEFIADFMRFKPSKWRNQAAR